MPDSSAAPHSPDAISALARQHGGDAVQALVRALASSDPQAAVHAAVALLDVGYGQPVQPIALDSAHGIAVEVHTSKPPGSRSNGDAAEPRDTVG